MLQIKSSEVGEIEEFIVGLRYSSTSRNLSYLLTEISETIYYERFTFHNVIKRKISFVFNNKAIL